MKKRAIFHLMLCGLMGTFWGCDSDSDSAGTRTTIVTGTGYGKECEDNVNCRTGLSCIEETEGSGVKLCLPAGDTAEGAPCTLSAECTDGLYCGTAKTCAPAGEAAQGEPCSSTLDCQGGLLCGIQGFELVCLEGGTLDVGEECQFATECLAGLGCVNGSCIAGGETCQNAVQCGGRVCLDGFCSTGADIPIPEIYPGVTCDRSDTGPLRSLFEVPREGTPVTEFYRAPFPNNIHRKGGTLTIEGHPTPPLQGISGPLVQGIIDRIEAELDGFGLNPTIYFRFSSTIDLNSLTDAQDQPRFKLIDLTAWQAAPTEDAPLLGVSWAAAAGNGSQGLYICDNWLGLRVPWGRPLKPERTYAAVVLKGITGERGDAVASQDLTDILGASAPADPALSHAYSEYQLLRDYLSSDAATNQGINRDDVINATVFTTQSHEKSIPLLRDVIRAEADPVLSELTLCDGNAATTSPCDDGLEGEEHTRGCFQVHPEYYEFQGKLSFPIFQEGTPPYFELENGGAFSVDANGSPQKTGDSGVCVSITIPKNATMPADGWPIVIYAHGTGGDYRANINSGAAELITGLSHNSTEAAAITIGYDGVSHGDRRLDSTKEPQTLYFNFTNPQAARGNIMQGVADIFHLTRFAEGFALDENQSPTGVALNADPAKVYLMAHSQGTNYGPIALPYEPNLDAAVLSGAGGGFMLSTVNKTKPVDIAGGIKIAFSDPNINEYHPVLNLAQMFIDVGDVVNYGESILIEPEPSRCTGDPVVCDRPHVFHAYGVGDNFTPDPSQKALAVSMGVYLVTPAVDSFGGVVETTLPVSGNYAGVTAFVRQYQPDQDYDGHFVLLRHPDAIADLQAFLGSLIVDGVPTVGAQ